MWFIFLNHFDAHAFYLLNTLLEVVQSFTFHIHICESAYVCELQKLFKKEMLLSMIQFTIIQGSFTLKCLVKEITLQVIWYGTCLTMNARLLHAIYLGNTRWPMSFLAMRLLDKIRIHLTTSITLLNHRLIPFCVDIWSKSPIDLYLNILFVATLSLLIFNAIVFQ
jgi:hypothetical protein